jgi:nucleotide-binding universal stress UspA family protein
MSDNRNVVVGVDGRESSWAAVDFAAAEAARRGSRLRLLEACPRRGDGPHTTLTAVVRRVCATWPGLDVVAHNVTADPADALVRASRSADLLVVGRRARAAGRRPGSTGAHLAAHGLCPVVVVPPESPVPDGDHPVMLGLGMSPEDEPAIAFAFEEVAARGVPLVAVHVWAGVPGTALGRIDPFSYDLPGAQAAADRAVAETLAGWADKYPDVRVERMPLYDANPARTLLDASHRAGLVVVGARRHGDRSIHLLGGVTRTLIQQAVRPVAVIRPGHLR